VISASVIPEKGLFYIRVWVFFIPVRINPFAIGSKKKAKSTGKGPGFFKSIRNKKSAGRVRRILHAIRLRKLKLDMDTDDVIMNAWLIPAFSAVNQHRNIQLQVNFEGNFFMDLDARTRLGVLLWMLIKR
jgi:hypothetical protein